MALWSNTADGWGSDPSSSGNGALGTYLQSSAATAPKSQSLAQAQDPSNSMPTSSIVRTVQPAASKLTYGAPAQSGTLATVLSAPAQSQAVPYTPPTVADFKPSAQYTGPTVYAQSLRTDHGDPDGFKSQAYYGVDPKTNQVTLLGYRKVTGSGGLLGSGYRYGYLDQYGNVLDPNSEQVKQFTAADTASTTLQGQASGSATQNIAGASQQLASVLDPIRQAQASETAQAKATQQAQSAENNKNYYLQQLLNNGGKLSPQVQGIDPAVAALDNESRNAALQEYQANKASAAAISRGVAPVDTSTQDAINRSSLNSLASRFSTSLSGANIGAMGRLYAGAITDQSGVNKQLSDEDYAARFNQNVSAFTQAVQAQSTLDANATGTKLQSDVQAAGDAIQSLQQQASQLGSQAGIAVQSHLNALQKQLNEYEQAARLYGAASSTAMSLAKAFLGAAVGVTAIALAPVSGGTSLVAGLGVASAIAK